MDIMWITSNLEVELPSQWLTAFGNTSSTNEDKIVEHFIGTWLCELELLYFCYQIGLHVCTYICTYVYISIHT